MINSLFQFFSVLGNEFALFIISMIPLIEERGAIIYGSAISMPWTKVLPICIVANMLPVPILLIFGMKILNWGKSTKLFGNFLTKYEVKLNSKSKQLEKYGSLALLVFTGFPIPGTGAWSGSLLATILKFDFKKALISIFVGVIMCGIIMTIACYGTFGIFKLFI